MSTNYYINTKDTNMVFDLMPRVEILKEERCFEIHLCQSAWNLKPLFESHSYHSFEELKDILLNKGYDFEIVDEYRRKYTPTEFIEMMEKENKGKSRMKEWSKIISDKDGYEFVDGDFC